MINFYKINLKTILILLFLSLFIYNIKNVFSLTTYLDYSDPQFININYFDLGEVDINRVIELIGIQLENNMAYNIDPYKPILISTLVNLNDFNETCELARIIKEGLSYYFIKKGYRIKEIRLRKDSVLIKKNRGEFALTRDIKLLLKEYNTQSLIVGTYIPISQREFFISLKIISNIDNGGISSFIFTIHIPRKYIKLILPQYIKPAIEEKKGEIEKGKRILKKENKEDVKIVQARLKELGLYDGKIDGIWGKRTQRALELFKKAVGIKPENTWDLQTQKRLFKGTNM